ncbi:MAG TPA: hypothetical protein VFZ69_12475 [Longimicrobiales bacterium]
MTMVVLLLLALLPAPVRTAPFPLAPRAATDTLHLEVGSPEVNGLVFPPHRARNTVYIGDATTPVTTWTNELTVADSAGMTVHRWVTRGTRANGDTWELHQTYDGRTLAPLRWAMRSSAGADSRLQIDGTRVRGKWKGPADAAPAEVDRTIPRAGFIASASDLVPMAVGLRDGLVMTAPVWSPQGTDVEVRVFTVLGEESVTVEGGEVVAWKVEERVHATGELRATWWLTNASPYMVLAEIPLANGQTQRITGVALD